MTAMTTPIPMITTLPPDAAAASPAEDAPGRVCPLRYRYGPHAIARADVREADTLYVVGGLYGNVPALDAIEAMARAETRAQGSAPTLCFNGDFNWFDVDDAAFAEINRRVLACDALLGNVEAELDAPGDDAGCGCAYPPSVDSGVVERSNLIHARLKATAARHPALLARIARLPMLARYRVADCRVGVVHGDADPTVSVEGSRTMVAALKKLGATVTYVEVPGGNHTDVVVPNLPRVFEFLAAHTKAPAPR